MTSKTKSVADNNHASMDAENVSKVDNVDTKSPLINDLESVTTLEDPTWTSMKHDAESIKEEDIVDKNSMILESNSVREEELVNSKATMSINPYTVVERSDNSFEELFPTTTRKKWIIMFLSLIGLLIFGAGTVLIIAFIEIFKISAELDLIQSILPSIEIIMINEANITRQMESVKLIESSIEKDFENELGMFSELNNQLNANVSTLLIKFMEFQRTAALNFTRLNSVVNNHLSNFSNITSSQLSFFNQIINEANANISLTYVSSILEVFKNTGYIFPSCAAIKQKLSPSSGNYFIRSSNGSSFNAYCDMTRSCGGITGGWMRVVELDLTNTTTQCPGNLELLTTPRRTCIAPSSESGICISTIFTVNINYSKVCGRIIAYQVGSPDGFHSSRDIDSIYLDGVSLTHGMSPRKHIWSFVSTYSEAATDVSAICSCLNINIQFRVPSPPSFVGNNYFCGSGNRGFNFSDPFFADNPLWNGTGCGPLNRCCSFNSPPWFYNPLPQSTTDNIEMRVCLDQSTSDENIAIEIIEIYVQ